MKWLILDDPHEHMNPNNVAITPILGIFDQEFEVSRSLSNSLELMASRDFDFVIIHHYDFDKVDTLKNMYPKPKYICDSANNTNSDYRKKMLEHYDLIMPLCLTDFFMFIKNKLPLQQV